MPKPLEDHVYRRIEWNLHNVKELEEAEAAIRREIFEGGGPSFDHGLPRGISKHSDPTANKALALTDCKPRQWLEAIASTFEYYDPQSPEGRMARLYYGRNVTIKTVADRMKCTERTIHYYRDDFVFRCALFAAERGLIRLSNGKRD